MRIQSVIVSMRGMPDDIVYDDVTGAKLDNTNNLVIVGSVGKDGGLTTSVINSHEWRYFEVHEGTDA